jgi:hypothetical protein
MYEIPKHLFFRRDHPQAYTHVYYSKKGLPDYRNQLVWWTGHKTKKLIVLPHVKNFLEFFNSVNRVPLKLSERLLCYREICRWLLNEEGLQMMKWDFENEFQIWRTRLRKGHNK